MDPIQRTRVQGHVDNTEELKEQKKKKSEITIPPARDWDSDGTAARDFARNALPQESKSTVAPRERAIDLNDHVLYLGMTGSAGGELQALRSTGATVIAVQHAATNDHVNVGGKDFDLAKESDALDFARAIGLTGVQAKDVARVIQSANPGSRDELAGIAQTWASAERGGSAASRLVLSGHSSGSDVHGSDTFQFEQLRDLAHAMPRGAGYVEDIELSGCNTGINATADRERMKWTAAFPRLQTISGYQGSCPSPGGADLVGWEHATRGRTTSISLSSAQIAGDLAVGNRAGKIDSWIVRLPLADLKARLSAADARFATTFAGTGPKLQHDAYDKEGNYSTLFADYEICKGATARNDLSPSDVARYETRAEQLLRLRYWSDCTKSFDVKYGETIARGLAAAKMPPVDLATIDRPAAIHLANVLDRTGSGPEVERARHLLDALRDLDPKIIEQGWCGHA